MAGCGAVLARALRRPAAVRLGRALQLPRTLAATYSSGRRGAPGEEKDDRFQYDMKEPQLDAGFANMYQADANMLSVTASLPTGFRLSNGHTVYGPLLIVNNQPFSLRIPPPAKDTSGAVTNPLLVLDPDALALLEAVAPKPELLIVGGGASISPLSPSARSYLTSIGLGVELASTRHATSTFDTLAEEGRNVALLVLPAGVDTHQ
ncbi:hypothetical protein H4R19_003010 [Coemansia spiralis]|nr:hypothetical protein H4R19_003010 [Coemansia spiralis]